MAVKRYELSDTQWEQIREMIPRAKTGRPPKDDRLMLRQEAVRPGQIFPSVTAPIKVYTAASASGVTTVRFCAFFRI